MKIYISASWKHQHAVEMLTEKLRNLGCEVISFVEKAVSDEGRTDLQFDLTTWIWSDDGYKKFLYDIDGAMNSDLVIYIGPSGLDAWAEVGAAFGSGVPIFALEAKGETVGLMRRMVRWFDSVELLLLGVIGLAKEMESS